MCARVVLRGKTFPRTFAISSRAAAQELFRA
jgi:hypothetical protein